MAHWVARNARSACIRQGSFRTLQIFLPALGLGHGFGIKVQIKKIDYHSSHKIQQRFLGCKRDDYLPGRTGEYYSNILWKLHARQVARSLAMPQLKNLCYLSCHSKVLLKSLQSWSGSSDFSFLNLMNSSRKQDLTNKTSTGLYTDVGKYFKNG